MSTITATIARALRGRRTTPRTHEVHLHGGAHGAYVCDNANCDSPALDPSEA